MNQMTTDQIIVSVNQIALALVKYGLPLSAKI